MPSCSQFNDYVIHNVIANDAELHDVEIIGVRFVPCEYWHIEFTCLL